MIAPGTNDPDEEWALKEFPQLSGLGKRTSDPTINYNCFAWALGVTNSWITPISGMPGYYWPPGIPREWSVAAARQILAGDGYTEETTNRDLEPDWEKVAIYTKTNGDLSHFARQLPTGAWTSKLGSQIDIEHATLECLQGNSYGIATLVLKRRKKN